MIIVLPSLYITAMGSEKNPGQWYLIGFSSIALWLIISLSLGQWLLSKFLSDSSQSSKVTKLVVALSPLWIFPAIFCVVVLANWCLDYYL